MRFKCCFCNMECEKNKEYWECELCHSLWTDDYNLIEKPENNKREGYKVTTISSYDCPKIEKPIDKDILNKYKWESLGLKDYEKVD